jgi:multidrug resistance efflux pump
MSKIDTDALRTALGMETAAEEQARIERRLAEDRAKIQRERARIEQEETERRETVRRAQNLRRTSHLSKRTPGTGPRIAR